MYVHHKYFKTPDIYIVTIGSLQRKLDNQVADHKD